MKYQIVSDSSSNLLTLDGVAYNTVPLHIVVGAQSFVDDSTIDVDAMNAALQAYRGTTSTACPSPNDWLNAFGDADAVFCVTITSGLSGSFNSALTAKQMYEEEHPDRSVYLIDSLSTGPEMVLLLEKIKELIEKEIAPEEIYQQVQEYHKHTHLYYALASLNNLAKNGRVNPIVAKGIGILGIRVIGTTTPEGTLHPTDKARGDKKAVMKLCSILKENGYQGGRIIISHSGNPVAAETLRFMIEAEYGSFNGFVHSNTGLCSYYAEPGSLLLGFEN